MIRQIIKIDSEKCNGCGLCVKACHEGAIAMIDGKAKLTRDDYCDGLGNCLPACPTNAITFENREAQAYDEVAVKKHMDNKQESKCPSTQNHVVSKEGKLPCGCPSTAAMTFDKKVKAEEQANSSKEGKLPCGCPSTAAMTFDKKVKAEDKPKLNKSENEHGKAESELRQFPIQIKLVSPSAPYFDGCDLLIAADCTAFAYGAFHKDFIKGKITLIGCPKLDEGDYSDKLTEILVANDINSLTVVRMEVPCCGGIVQAVKTALKNSDKIIPWQIITISRSGEIVK